VGFCGIVRVPSFGLFEDTSEMTLFGRAISLNVAAVACPKGGSGEGFGPQNDDPISVVAAAASAGSFNSEKFTAVMAALGQGRIP
jgi:hypothetical protein